jgi:hypothetical protein
MRTKILCLSCVLGLWTALGAASVARANDITQMVDAYLQDLGAVGYTMTPVNNQYAIDSLAGFSFLGVYFDQWPLQIQPPEGLSLSNVFYLDTATLQLGALTGPEDLKQFFATYFDQTVSPNSGHPLKEVAKTWLRLSQEFSQDGFYQFSKPVVEVDGRTAYGSVTVIEGGRGFIWVTLTLDPLGGISIEEDRHVIPGDRPI